MEGHDASARSVYAISTRFHGGVAAPSLCSVAIIRTGVAPSCLPQIALKALSTLPSDRQAADFDERPKTMRLRYDRQNQLVSILDLILDIF